MKRPMHTFSVPFPHTRQLAKAQTQLEALFLARAAVGWHVPPPNPNKAKQLDSKPGEHRLILY